MQTGFYCRLARVSWTDGDDAVVDQHAVGPIDMTVTYTIDGQQATLNSDVGITARHEAEFVWTEGLAGWNAGPVTVCDDDTVLADFRFDASKKQIV
jgi:hypothetical protein